MSDIFCAGIFKAERTIIIVTRPAEGIPDAPIEANVAVIEVTTKSMNV
jgi:hypothetical protein